MSIMPVSHVHLQQKACQVLLERRVLAVTSQDEGGIPGSGCEHTRLTPVFMSRYCACHASDSSTHRELTAPTSGCNFRVVGANKQEALIDFL